MKNNNNKKTITIENNSNMPQESRVESRFLSARQPKYSYLVSILKYLPSILVF